MSSKGPHLLILSVLIINEMLSAVNHKNVCIHEG